MSYVFPSLRRRLIPIRKSSNAETGATAAAGLTLFFPLADNDAPAERGCCGNDDLLMVALPIQIGGSTLHTQIAAIYRTSESRASIAPRSSSLLLIKVSCFYVLIDMTSDD